MFRKTFYLFFCNFVNVISWIYWHNEPEKILLFFYTFTLNTTSPISRRTNSDPCNSTIRKRLVRGWYSYFYAREKSGFYVYFLVVEFTQFSVVKIYLKRKMIALIILKNNYIKWVVKAIYAMLNCSVNVLEGKKVCGFSSSYTIYLSFLQIINSIFNSKAFKSIEYNFHPFLHFSPDCFLNASVWNIHYHVMLQAFSACT